MSAGLPQGFREGHAGDLACPHRDVTCCVACQVAHPEVVIVGGQAFWIANHAERAELAALETARITSQMSLFNHKGTT